MQNFKFGTAVRDISPEYPIWLNGYGSRSKKSTDISEPLSLAALALSDGTTTLMFITMDLIGLTTQTLQEYYELLEKETGIGFPNFMFCCSHTHFAPVPHASIPMWASLGIVEANLNFVEDFKMKVVQVAKDALCDMNEGTVETARFDVPQVSFNRRTIKADGTVENNYVYPENSEEFTFEKVDSELSVLKIKDDCGNVRAVLLNYGCHPVAGGDDSQKNYYSISSDYPYYVRKEIEEHYSCPAFFTLGAAGDSVPVNRYGKSRQQIGKILGGTILLGEKQFVGHGKPKIICDSVNVEMPTIFETDPPKAEKDFYKAQKISAAKMVSDEADSKKSADMAMNDPYSEKTMVYERSKLYPDNKFSIPIQFFKIGEIVFVSFPFEVVSEISLKLKEACPNAVIVSCAAGYQGYLPLAYQFAMGGYEAHSSECHFAEATGNILLKQVVEWINAHK